MNAAASEPVQSPRWRGIAAWVLVVLTAIAVTASVIGLWVHRVAFETDAFMAAVTPVVESESVQAVVSDRVAADVVEALELEARIATIVSEAEDRLATRIGEALGVSPTVLEALVDARLGLDQIAPALAAGAEARIEDAVHRFISSPDGTETLLSLVEVAHERTILLLRDELDQLPNLVIEDGEVRFNLVPLMAGALRAAVNQGLEVVGIEREIPPFESTEDAEQAVERLADIIGRDLPDDFGQISVGSEEGLRRAQDLARTFDRVVWLVLLVTVALGAGAVLLAPSIRRGIVRVGIAATIGALAGWVIVEAITAGLPDAAATADGRLAISDLTGALVTDLRTIALLLAGIGILAAFFAILPTVAPRRIDGGQGPLPATAAPVPSPEPAPTPPARADAPAAVDIVTEEPPRTEEPSPKASSPSRRPRRTRRPKAAPPPPADDG